MVIMGGCWDLDRFLDRSRLVHRLVHRDLLEVAEVLILDSHGCRGVFPYLLVFHYLDDHMLVLANVDSRFVVDSRDRQSWCCRSVFR